MRLIEFLEVGGYTNDIDNKWNTMSIKDRVGYIKNDLLKRGYTQNQTAAILGNLMQENRGLQTHTQNTSSGALGIAQWLGSRKKSIMASGKHSTISGQLDFLDQEIKGKGAWTNNVGGKNAFFNTDDPKKLTVIFRKDFERPGEHEARDDRRISNAYSVLGQQYVPTGEFDSGQAIETFIPTLPPDMKKGLSDWNNFKTYAKKNPSILEVFNPDIQQQFTDNIQLENERLLQEQKKSEVEQENLQIQQALEEKQRMREQILSMVPQAQSINSGNIQAKVFQNGGEVEYMQYGGMGKVGNAPYNFNDIKQMQLAYMQSPEYSKRLKANGYDNYLDTKLRRIIDVNAVRRTKEPTKNPVSMGLRNILGDTPFSHYNSDKPNEVNLYRQEADMLGAYPSTIVAHELGHAETKSGLNDMEREMITGSMRLDMFNSGNVDDHDKDPEEIKSDINAIRYNLYKSGQFDPKTGKWKTRDGRFDPSLLKNIKDDFSTKRMKMMYDDDSLKYIMDSIALNDNRDQDLMFAQKGGWVPFSQRAVNPQAIKEFYNDMINAPWYKQRLQQNGYNSNLNPANWFRDGAQDEVNFRSRRVQNTRVNKIDMSKLPFSAEEAQRYSDITKAGTHWMSRTNEVNYKLNDNALDEHLVEPREVVTHELGHAESAGRLNDTEYNLLKDNLSNRTKDAHDKDPYESKADINALRYNLFRKGLYDPKTGKYKTKTGKFEKALLKDVDSSFMSKRLRQNYDDSKLEMLMNTIAFNDDNTADKLMYAKLGGILKDIKNKSNNEQ